MWLGECLGPSEWCTSVCSHCCSFFFFSLRVLNKFISSLIKQIVGHDILSHVLLKILQLSCIKHEHLLKISIYRKVIAVLLQSILW